MDCGLILTGLSYRNTTLYESGLHEVKSMGYGTRLLSKATRRGLFVCNQLLFFFISVLNGSIYLLNTTTVILLMSLALKHALVGQGETFCKVKKALLLLALYDIAGAIELFVCNL
jgi:hypothetical protein